MPKNDYLEFNAFNKMIMHPVFIVADFESNIEKLETSSGSTQKTARHTPCAYALKVVSHLKEWDLPVECYRGPDAAMVFILRLYEIYEELEPIISADVEMEPVTPEQKAEFDLQSDCHICSKPLDENKHLDHCHYTGKVLGYAHEVCNLQRKTPKKLPIIFHNFKGYDCHLLIKKLCELEDDLWNVKLIPKNMEKYTSVITEKFRFIDSLQHLSASLDELVENLKTVGEDKFKSIKCHVDELYGGSQRKLELLLRKGVYPFKYMDSFAKFEEGLPPIEEFHNDLKNEPCSAEDYQHVQNMWNEFGMRNMGDLCDVYVQSDVLLLADVLQEYRKECWENFSLDPLHYYTAPGLTFDAALVKTGVRLELLKDPSMYQFFEKAIRGGISVISKRYAKANNKYLPDFDPSEPSNFLWYIDANNLYGASMVEKQPVSDFKWTIITKEEIEQYDTTSDTGCFVEVDLEIPNNLHDKFNCFPVAPEPLEVTEKIASERSLA
ncbi:MAG: hypothetical protein GY816_09905, partial [Cytophagales bacterium]|nr:hypothetical protein [Cytophagales bacterium]